MYPPSNFQRYPGSSAAHADASIGPQSSYTASFHSSSPLVAIPSPLTSLSLHTTHSSPTQPAAPPSSSLPSSLSPSTYPQQANVDWQWLDTLQHPQPHLSHPSHPSSSPSDAEPRRQPAPTSVYPSVSVAQMAALHHTPSFSAHPSSLPPPHPHPSSPSPHPHPLMLHPLHLRAADVDKERDRHHYATVIQSITPSHARANGYTPLDPTLSIPALPLPPPPSIPHHSHSHPPHPLSRPPSSPPSSSPSASSSSSLSSSSRHKLSRRRKLACSTCRHVKSECSGDRPCRRCVRLNKAESCADPTTPYPPKKPRLSSKHGGGVGGGGAGGGGAPAAAGGGVSLSADGAVAGVRRDGAERLKDESGDAKADGSDSSPDSDAEQGQESTSPPSSPSPLLSDEDFRYTWLSESMYRQVIPHMASMFARTPAEVTCKSSTGLLYRMAHMMETMPPSMFKHLMDKVGYTPHTAAAAAAAAGGGGGGGQAERDKKDGAAALADGDKDEERSGGAEQHKEAKADGVEAEGSDDPGGVDDGAAKSPNSPPSFPPPTEYRSPHSHLPSISFPHRYRFNWSLTPDTAFSEEGLCSSFPTLMWYHYPPSAHWVKSDTGLIVPIPQSSDALSKFPFSHSGSLSTAGAGERKPLLPHEINLSLTDQHCVLLANTAAERLFGYSLRELKVAFIREGKRAFLRLFDSSIQHAHDHDMKLYNGQGQTDFYHFIGVRTKVSSTRTPPHTLAHHTRACTSIEPLARTYVYLW